MDIRIINSDYPIWEITNFDLPDLVLNELLDSDEVKRLEINAKREPRYLNWGNSNHFDFKEKWFGHTQKIQRYLQSGLAYEECTELLSMWPTKFERFEWGAGERSIQIIHDRTGFKMAPHIDNRMVIGVLLINLQDNPEGSGTTFHKDPGSISPWHQGPTSKCTGVFFLNNWNTWHSIENNGEYRLIAYDIMPLQNMFSRPFQQ